MGDVEPSASGPRNSVVGLLFHGCSLQDCCKDLQKGYAVEVQVVLGLELGRRKAPGEAWPRFLGSELIIYLEKVLAAEG